MTIPNGVTSIGEAAFRKCSSLTSLTLPNSVTSIAMIAFDECSNLTTLNIPVSVTFIGRYAFRDCDKLIQTVGGVKYVGDWVVGYDDSSVRVTFSANTRGISEYALYRCLKPTSINIPNGVAYICDCAFYECRSLTSIIIPGSVTDIGKNAFYWCNSLTNITFSGTMAQWGNISKNEGWDAGMGKFTVYCTDGNI